MIDSEISVVDDGEGNKIEITIEEYGEPESYSMLERPQNAIKLRSGYTSDYKVGTRKTFRFKIKNEDVGLPSLSIGVPLTSKMKKIIAKAVAKKLSEKVAASLIPGVNIVSWVLAAISYTNGRAGNTGFIVTFDCIYSETYIHKEGHYLYGWDIKSCAFNAY